MDYSFCCPSPQNPVIQPDQKAFAHRKNIRFLIYGQLFTMIGKFILLGPLSGIMQLISVWIVYSSWASMHFCTTMIVIFSASIDLIFFMLSFSQMQ